MRLKHIFIFLLTFISFSATASSLRDSLRIENLDGKKLIIHQIEPKETYYSLGRKYRIAPKTIIEFNSNMPLSIGAIVKIPTENKFLENKISTIPNVKSSDKKEITHVVQTKETLYGIATMYGMKVDELKTLNKLSSNSLNIGQELKVFSKNNTEQQSVSNIVKSVKTEIQPVVDNVSTKVVRMVDSTENASVLEIPKNRYGISEKHEKGIAVIINDESLDNSKSYALHSLAPTGTIIKITNPMTNRSVFAKVVGKYAENAATKDVIIVINKAVSEALGALDKRFLVNITYGLPNE